MLASLTELKSCRVQGSDGALEIRSICLSLSADGVAHRPILRATGPITPELEQSLRECCDRYPR